MKIHQIFTVLLLSIATLFTGCESYVEDIEGFKSESKLVAVSYISPQDTVLTVRLQLTQPALGLQLTEEQRKVKNATVTISDGSTVKALAYNPEKNHYEADARTWPIQVGKTYQLKVLSAVGNAEATCTIPNAAGITITDLQAPHTIETNYGHEMAKYIISFKWNDDAGIKNYYRTLLYRTHSYTDPYTGTKTEYNEGIYGGYSDGTDLKDDEYTNNGIISSNPVTYYSSNYNQDNGKPFKIYAVLVVADAHYYKYHKALSEQSSNNGNPFAEPVIMYTNIKGGLGVFAGYNQVVQSIEVQQ
ncbi:DUF4249 domain-containing protein [Pontibacter sp. H259]|uniref:DUF4249 domain-containing protein n=1 Tax=Pontibacter sp. H259 TaxID=3133421 RepID=UPI0030BDE6A8